MPDQYPATVGEAVESLVKSLSAADKKYVVKVARADGDLVRLHHTLGRWVRNHFGLWQGNHDLLADCARVECHRSAVHKSELHPDDASGVILQVLQDRLLKEVA